MSDGKQHPYLRAFEQAFSSVRMDAYRPDGCEDDLEVTAHYLWNIALCEAWFPSLHMLEVALRNRVDAVMSEEFPVDRSVDPHAFCWIDMKPSILEADEVKKVDHAMDRIRQRGGEISRGHLVAELSFGFWTSLFDRKYGNPKDCPVLLWPRLEQKMFPFMPDDKKNRPDMSRYLNDIREIRNRAFHYESLLEANVERAHRRLMEFIGWLRPALLPTVQAMDRFPEILAAGPARYRALAEPLAEAARLEAEARKAKRMSRAEKREAARLRIEAEGKPGP